MCAYLPLLLQCHHHSSTGTSTRRLYLVQSCHKGSTSKGSILLPFPVPGTHLICIQTVAFSFFLQKQAARKTQHIFPSHLGFLTGFAAYFLDTKGLRRGTYIHFLNANCVWGWQCYPTWAVEVLSILRPGHLSWIEKLTKLSYSCYQAHRVTGRNRGPLGNTH